MMPTNLLLLTLSLATTPDKVGGSLDEIVHGVKVE